MSSVSAHWLQRELVLNWRLIAVPSFLSITISFSCGLTIMGSNIVVQQRRQMLTVFVPPFKQCQWVWMRDEKCPGVEGIQTWHNWHMRVMKHVEYCKWLGFLSTGDKMVDTELGTRQFIFNFWAYAMKIQRSYCICSAHFAVSLPFNSASRRVQECL